MENYFNYFTEVEECYRRCRGTPILLSALDWALLESWREAGIPLEAVCSGVERTFQKYERSRRHKFLRVNGLGYCTQQVMLAAEEAKRAAVESGSSPLQPDRDALPFSTEEIQNYLAQSGKTLEQAAVAARQEGSTVIASDIEQAAAQLIELGRARSGDLSNDLEGLERSLTAIEEKLTAALLHGASLETLTRAREEVDRGIAPFRRTMSPFQIEALERQFLKKQLFECYQLPRLSLFYLRP